MCEGLLNGDYLIYICKISNNLNRQTKKFTHEKQSCCVYPPYDNNCESILMFYLTQQIRLPR
jgi:hypothetical protein